ncbi:tripartite tricarboxylate transporter substrate binding protein [Ruegeria sp. 2012CJ41-6]|uniref:Tripartite tricarboxylate transporter substrate binding protein n=1 Tax=Ruegeria spongiae TaxID=2942209 RepID=A0ABT0Q6U4_9RHOB|nr:tripartite tricarboxylate transporter substrate binding protein [Ruegeria spongiae]MCL6285599.1 tripartite tricarboxylate transporter substrate binding protein [Ruegeria spongiae]
MKLLLKSLQSYCLAPAALATLLTLSPVPVLVGEAMAESFPEKPVTLMIGFRAGGGMDTTASILIPEIEKALGQPVVKSMQPGGGGAKAASLLKEADPDGYTIALGATSTFAFNPVVIPDKTPYTSADFDYIVGLVGSGEAIMARADAPYDTFQEMIDYAKAGNDLTYSGQTPFDRILIQYLNRKEGINIKHISTKGGSEAIKNILGGHTDLSFTGGNHLKQYQRGEIKFLASLRPERLRDAPDVPSLTELGYPIDFGNVFFIVAPKGTPDDVKAKLAEAVSAARDSDAFGEYMSKTPYFTAPATGDEIVDAIAAQEARNREMMQALSE